MAAIAIENAPIDVGRAVEQAPSTNPSVTSATHTSTPPDATVPPGKDTTTITSKKKKKKRSKRSAKSKSEPNSKPLTEDDEHGPLVLRISRNKHWRYISSYHVCPLPFDPPVLLHNEREIGPVASAPARAPGIAPRPQSRPGHISARTTRGADATSPTTAPLLSHA